VPRDVAPKSDNMIFWCDVRDGITAQKQGGVEKQLTRLRPHRTVQLINTVAVGLLLDRVSPFVQ